MHDYLCEYVFLYYVNSAIFSRKLFLSIVLVINRYAIECFNFTSLHIQQ